jgi:hypothetical protein
VSEERAESVGNPCLNICEGSRSTGSKQVPAKVWKDFSPASHASYCFRLCYAFFCARFVHTLPASRIILPSSSPGTRVMNRMSVEGGGVRAGGATVALLGDEPLSPGPWLRLATRMWRRLSGTRALNGRSKDRNKNTKRAIQRPPVFPHDASTGEAGSRKRVMCKNKFFDNGQTVKTGRDDEKVRPSRLASLAPQDEGGCAGNGRYLKRTGVSVWGSWCTDRPHPEVRALDDAEMLARDLKGEPRRTHRGQFTFLPRKGAATAISRKGQKVNCPLRWETQPSYRRRAVLRKHRTGKIKRAADQDARRRFAVVPGIAQKHQRIGDRTDRLG